MEGIQTVIIKKKLLIFQNFIIKNQKGKNDLTLNPKYLHDIHLTENKIIYKRPYSILVQLKQKVEESLTDMVNNGIIEFSSPPYCSPAFVILKKNGNIRMVNDFRLLNQIIEKDGHSGPNRQEILLQLKESRIFSKPNMNS